MQKNQNILLISPQLVIGGSEKALINLAEAMLKLNYNVHILTLNDNIELPIAKELLIHKIKPFKWIRAKYIKERIISRKIAQLYRDLQFSICISNFTTTRKWLPKEIEQKTFYYVHFDYRLLYEKYRTQKQHKFAKFKKKIFNYFNNRNLICVSKGVEKTLLKTFSIIPSSSHILYNNLDFNKIRKLSDAYFIKHNTPYIIHVGRFDLENKRQDLLLEAFTKIKTDIELIMLTQINETLEDMVSQHPKKNKIKLIPFTPNPYPWMRAAKLLILCSDSEAFGNVLVEALALGTPVISTNCYSGPREILTGTMSKWLVEPNDSNALANKIDACLTLNHYQIDEKHLHLFSTNSALATIASIMESKK